jgi:hypothetical protein
MMNKGTCEDDGVALAVLLPRDHRWMQKGGHKRHL